jgi:hypothetical protein
MPMSDSQFRDASAQLAGALERRSPVLFDDVSYTLSLISITSQDTGSVEVIVAAKPAYGPTTHTGELHISPARLDEEDFPDLVVELMRRIVAGDLPPGARELL